MCHLSPSLRHKEMYTSDIPEHVIVPGEHTFLCHLPTLHMPPFKEYLIYELYYIVYFKFYLRRTKCFKKQKNV